ncbi:hypothetical protein FPCIR_12910 [Fusarium pseudocircinatum]|uniref:Uncharacterized protein n=1 Tax=Fusarium pseudocircinatum TaxID=56676 RepID=A0A8H5KP11_9HYPO|nr:hypothetical protein FPCIR_12910 [Fusarium pseudocircinatum]
MAPNQYKITVINKSGLDKTYLLFQTNPTQNEKPSPTVFLNVYQASAIVPKGEAGAEASFATFKIVKQWYAVNGTAPSPLGNGVTVSTTQSEEVTLGQGEKKGSTLALTTINGDGLNPRFEKDITLAAPNGAYQVKVDKTIKYPSPTHIFIGLGAPDPLHANLVVPVASVPATPSNQFTIWPHNKWYIASGDFQQGTIIDVQTIGPTQLVDFETGLPSQTFVNNPDGTYSPSGKKTGEAI